MRALAYLPLALLSTARPGGCSGTAACRTCPSALGRWALAPHARPVLGALAVAAGICTLPVALQVVSEDAARWLAVAAPLWLAFIAASAGALWRRGGARRVPLQGGGDAAQWAAGVPLLARLARPRAWTGSAPVGACTRLSCRP